MENIFVPSKGRANSARFLQYAAENEVHVNVVVEPQEAQAYAAAYPQFHLIVLPENNQGITYVRNFIKQYTTEKGLRWYWQLDDDITGLFKRFGTKLERRGVEVLQESGNLFIEHGIALGGLEYRQFAWSATKDLISNSFCDSCVMVDNELAADIHYRQYVEGKEDRDFAMQLVAAGLKTARTTLQAFSAPPNGSNAGGLKEIFYDAGKEAICATRMVETWGENICTKIVKPGGRIDVKINWNNIANAQHSLF